MTIDSLQQRLLHILPAARLEQVVLNPLRLWLLTADYPQGELSAEQVRQVMDNPLYRVFCRASGQVLVADSWIKGFGAPGYRQLTVGESCTLPDLDESAAFREMRIYLGSGTSLPSTR